MHLHSVNYRFHAALMLVTNNHLSNLPFFCPFLTQCLILKLSGLSHLPPQTPIVPLLTSPPETVKSTQPDIEGGLQWDGASLHPTEAHLGVMSGYLFLSACAIFKMSASTCTCTLVALFKTSCMYYCVPLLLYFMLCLKLSQKGLKSLKSFHS